MEDCVLFREYFIDDSMKMRVGSEVQDPFRDSEWIKTTEGKGGGGGERCNPEWEVGPQEEWNHRTLCESGTFIRIRQNCVQKVLSCR